MKSLFEKSVIFILIWEARMTLRRYKPKIIAVTGSVGKTSTKDAIYTALYPHAHVRCSEKSYNSEMGVPLSILGLPNGWRNPLVWIKNIFSGLGLIIFPHRYPEWLVLEVGTDKPGDIKSIAKWLKPHVVVITRFPDVPVHVEFFESKEHVIAEKTSLAEALCKDGILVLNGDDEAVLKLAGMYGSKTITYGQHETLLVRAKHLEFSYAGKENDRMPTGREWTLVTPDVEYIVSQPHIIGDSHITASLSACAVIYALGFPLEPSVNALHDYHTPPGRLSLLKGIHGSILIDDTYNSSPVAAHSALDLLKEIKTTGRKFAVLGDMMELGKFTQEAHHELGTKAADVCDFLVTVGIRAQTIDIGAKESGFNETHISHFERADQAGEYLKSFIEKGDVVLAKGSQSVRLEHTVKMIMAEPQHASEILVRQEKEWEER